MERDPGMLRHRGTLQGLSIVEDEGGGQAETWADVVTVWAEVASLGGNEQLNAMAVGVTAPHRVRLRYRTGVTPKNRFVEHHPEGDRIHEITSVRDVDGKRSELELLTEWIP